MLKEARLYDSLEGGKTRCNVCPRRCVVAPGKRGACGTRKNVDGKLYSLVYGSLSSEAVDPIEKKPLYNFWPGSVAYSVATVGCSLKCEQCQNWQISQALPSEDGRSASLPGSGGPFRGRRFPLKEVTPEALVERVKEAGAESIAYTYNEPLIWHEYVLDCSKLAHENGLNNVLVSNGYSTPEATAELAPHLDAANIDVKAFIDDFYRDICKVPSMEPVLDTIVRMKEQGVFIELTTLLIPGLNDSPREIGQLLDWVVANVGPETPLHFSAFHPDYKLTDRPRTSSATLQRAWDLAREKGLHYVYLGNVRSGAGEHTYCPNCGSPVVKRAGFSILEVDLTERNECGKCGTRVNIRGPVSRSAHRGWW
ncbi:MAG: AmmeMemoRadiSam system radical SAM enzyme [Promethearchaeota archaeon]